MVQKISAVGISNFASNDVSQVHGDPVNLQKPFDNDKWKKPEHLYFVYIRVNRDPQALRVKHFFRALDGQALSDVESGLLQMARSNTGQEHIVNYEFETFDFQDKPCYVTLVLDEQHWNFYPHPHTIDTPAVVMRRNKIVMLPDGTIELQEFSPNQTFYNYERTQVADQDGIMKPAIRWVNFFKKDKFGGSEHIRVSRDDPTEQAKQNRYCFDVYLRMPYASTSAGLDPSDWLTVIFDPVTPPRF